MLSHWLLGYVGATTANLHCPETVPWKAGLLKLQHTNRWSIDRHPTINCINALIQLIIVIIFFIIKPNIFIFLVGVSAWRTHLELNRNALQCSWHNKTSYFPQYSLSVLPQKHSTSLPFGAPVLHIQYSLQSPEMQFKGSHKANITDGSHRTMARVTLGPMTLYCQGEGLAFQSSILPWTQMDDHSILWQAISICLDTLPTSDRKESQDPS